MGFPIFELYRKLLYLFIILLIGNNCNRKYSISSYPFLFISKYYAFNLFYTVPLVFGQCCIETNDCTMNLRSIPVIQKYCQLNKKEPQGKIELHLGGCKQNNHKPEVQNEFNTE